MATSWRQAARGPLARPKSVTACAARAGVLLASTGRASIHEAQKAASAVRLADRSPSPPRRPGKLAMICALMSSLCSSAPKIAQNVCQMASSCASA